jgi:hypothetical protein
MEDKIKAIIGITTTILSAEGEDYHIPFEIKNKKGIVLCEEGQVLAQVDDFAKATAGNKAAKGRIRKAMRYVKLLSIDVIKACK